MINAQTKFNLIIGCPLGHSKTPSFHTQKYQEKAYNYIMLAMENDNIEACVQCIKILNTELVAVTIPHKESVIQFLDHVDDFAKTIKSVNTILQKNGKLYGFNTDYIGIENSLKGIDFNNKNVLLIGAGGASRPVAFFVNQKKANLFCMNRNFDKAKSLTDEFGGKPVQESQLKDINFDVIINATPIGMHPNQDVSPLKKQYIKKNQIIFDLVYNPKITLLMRHGIEKGAQVISGESMFESQALEQIKLWEQNILQINN